MKHPVNVILPGSLHPTRRVLIVDDNVESAKTLGWMLEVDDHDVVLAHDGPAALKAAQEHKPDVVILDIGMPGMNGYEACQILRRMPEFAGATFIAQTGWDKVEHRELSREAGFNYHMVKPINAEALRAIVRGDTKEE